MMFENEKPCLKSSIRVLGETLEKPVQVTAAACWAALPPPDGLVANPAHLEYVKQIAALHFHSLAKKCQADWAKFPTLTLNENLFCKLPLSAISAIFFIYLWSLDRYPKRPDSGLY